eukprot:gene16005-18979_t
MREALPGARRSAQSAQICGSRGMNCCGVLLSGTDVVRGTGSYYDMDALANVHKQNTRLQSVLIFVCMITTFKYMSVSPVYGIVVRTVIKAGPSLFQFFVMFTITCYTFAVMGV